jgi:hypothetical protein
MSDFNSIPVGLTVPAQIPLDVKVYTPDVATLINLGTNNNKAYSYYEGMIVYCVENKNRYEWKEAVPELGPGLMPSNFTYPDGLTVFNIDYSEREFNFFLRPETLDLFSLGDGIPVYKGYNDTENRHEFLSVASNSILITTDGNRLVFELPSVFEGTDYYVNSNYIGDEETGSVSKPFKSLLKCIDKILNRGSENSPSVNSGLPYNKWDNRGMVIRVIIQSYVQINENLAINDVVYFLDNNSVIEVPGTNTTLERVFDMQELVTGCPKDGSNRLTHNLSVFLRGTGRIAHNGTARKGIVKSVGYNNGTPTLFQNGSYFYLGDINSEITYEISKRTDITYVTLYSDLGNTIPIVREGVTMTGNVQASTPDYGVIQFEGRNAPFGISMFIAGFHFIGAYEQQLIYGKSEGSCYGETGTLYFRRNYQHVNYSSVKVIETKKYYAPSEHVYDIYLKDGSVFQYGGNFYTQENTAAFQGGQESFVCIESTNPLRPAVFNANGGGIIYRLFYNHYFKIINDSSFLDYATGQIAANNLNIDCIPFISVIEVVDETDNPKTEIITPLFLKDCYLRDKTEQELSRLPFSNIALNSELFIDSSFVKIKDTIMMPQLQQYADNAAALAADMPISSLYKDASGNLKIVE